MEHLSNCTRKSFTCVILRKFRQNFVFYFYFIVIERDNFSRKITAGKKFNSGRTFLKFPYEYNRIERKYYFIELNNYLRYEYLNIIL